MCERLGIDWPASYGCSWRNSTKPSSLVSDSVLSMCMCVYIYMYCMYKYSYMMLYEISYHTIRRWPFSLPSDLQNLQGHVPHGQMPQLSSFEKRRRDVTVFRCQECYWLVISMVICIYMEYLWWYLWNICNDLVGGWGKTPLKNMTSSIGMMTYPIYGKIIKSHVPNHQPG